MRRVGAFLVLGLVVPATAGATSIGRVTLPQMIGTADVVFVGVFERAEPATLGGLGGARYRLRAERFFRGGDAATVHLSVPDIPGVQLGLELGQRYLVFAERRRFGRKREDRLTASGYSQGVYELRSEATAWNESNGEVALHSLPTDLRREARVRVSIVHDVDVSRRAYIEGAAYVVRLERNGRVVAKEQGFFESARRLRVRNGWYTIRSGAHPCGGDLCRTVDFQNDLGVDRCEKRAKLEWPKARIRIVARAGEPCRISVG